MQKLDRRAERAACRPAVAARRLPAGGLARWLVVGALACAGALVATGAGSEGGADISVRPVVVEQSGAGLFVPDAPRAPQSGPLPAPRGATEALIYTQPPLQGNLGVGPFGLIAATSSCVFGYAAADDFTLPVDRAISRIAWSGVYFGPEIDLPGDDRNVSVTIFRDNGAGNAGQVVLHLDNVGPMKSRNPRAPIFGIYPVYDYAVEVDPPFVAQQGVRYWMMINIDPGGFLGPLWGWLASAVGNAAETPAHDQPLIDDDTSCATLLQPGFLPGGPQGLDADLAFTLSGVCAPSDCNCNGRPDSVDIQTGASSDCNANGVPDECDVAEGRASDCDSDGIPDSCQLLPVYTAMSTNMRPTGAGITNTWTAFSVPRAAGPVTVTVRARSDLNLDTETLTVRLAGQQIAELFMVGGHDCPANPDVATFEITPAVYNNARNAGGHVTFQIDSGPMVSSTLCGSQQFVSIALSYRREDGGDLDGNGVYDPCDVQSGGATDCNDNGILDQLELDGPFESTSPAMSSFGAGDVRSHTLNLPPMAVSDVTLQVAARGDFSSTDEYVEILVNGVLMGRVLEVGAHDCPVLPDVGQLVLPASTWNAIRQAGANVVVSARPSFAVSPSLCTSPSQCVITVAYLARGQKDCDGNGILDECDIASGRTTDHNGNGRPDFCDTAGDISGDDHVNSVDLAMLLADWGTPSPRSDLNHDGRVDSRDLGLLLSYYGS